MKFMVLKGAIEIIVNNDVSINDMKSSISNELKKYDAVNIVNTDNTIHFKSRYIPIKFTSNPLFPVSSGIINISNKNSNYLVQYTLSLKHLFWQCNIAVITFILFLINTNYYNPTVPTIVATIIGSVLLYFFTYTITYGATGVRFNNLLKKAYKYATNS